MNSALAAVVFATAATLCTAAAAQKPTEKTPAVRLFVPAYFYPAGEGAKEWDKLLAAGERVPIVAIVNPASGPGRRVDPNYTAILKRAAKVKQLTLIGYVTTSYAKRPAADVQADVDLWLKLYPGIEGIFFDEQASAAHHVDYQAELYRFVRETRKLQLVITNPGTTCDEGFVANPAADVVCLFEGPRPFDSAPLPDWRKEYSADRAAVLSYQVESVEVMQRLVAFAAGKHLGYCYVTDAAGTNPWDRLPGYWDEQVSAVQAFGLQNNSAQ